VNLRLVNLRLVNLRLVNVKATWLWPLEPVAVGAGKASRGLCSRYVGDYCTFHQKLQGYLQVGVQGSGGVVRRSGTLTPLIWQKRPFLITTSIN
jgi:hypothetical protein